jgi:hypothetical protein
MALTSSRSLRPASQASAVSIMACLASAFCMAARAIMLQRFSIQTFHTGSTIE